MKNKKFIQMAFLSPKYHLVVHTITYVQLPNYVPPYLW